MTTTRTAIACPPPHSGHLIAHLDRDIATAVDTHRRWATGRAPDIGPHLAEFLRHVAAIATEAADAVTAECAVIQVAITTTGTEN